MGRLIEGARCDTIIISETKEIRMQIKKLLAGFGVTLALCAGCVPIEESNEPDPVPIRPALPAPGGLYSGSGWPIREVVFVSTQNAENTVDIDNLAGHSVYLVKINKGSTSVSARNTGHAYTASASSPNIRAATLP